MSSLKDGIVQEIDKTISSLKDGIIQNILELCTKKILPNKYEETYCRIN